MASLFKQAKTRQLKGKQNGKDVTSTNACKTTRSRKP